MLQLLAQGLVRVMMRVRKLQLLALAHGGQTSLSIHTLQPANMYMNIE